MNFQKIRTYGKTPPSLTAMEKIEEGRGNDRGKKKQVKERNQKGKDKKEGNSLKMKRKKKKKMERSTRR